MVRRERGKIKLSICRYFYTYEVWDYINLLKSSFDPSIPIPIPMRGELHNRSLRDYFINDHFARFESRRDTRHYASRRAKVEITPVVSPFALCLAIRICLYCALFLWCDIYTEKTSKKATNFNHPPFSSHLSDRLFLCQSFSPYSDLSKNVKILKNLPQIKIFCLGEFCTILTVFSIF
jgi:hypothetical protein